MSAWQIGKPKSEQTKKNISEAVRKAMANPELRNRLSQKAKERFQGETFFNGKDLSEESRAQISASLKEYNKQNPKPKNEPWIAEGISKTQWYRRQKQQTETPEQREARRAEKRARYHANGDKEREKMRLRYRRSREELPL